MRNYCDFIRSAVEIVRKCVHFLDKLYSRSDVNLTA